MEQHPEQQPYLNPMGFARDTSPMSLKDWLITLLLQAIPVVGFIFLIVWAVDNNSNVNKQNWARASLIMFALLAIIMIFVFIAFMGLFLNLVHSNDFR